MNQPIYSDDRISSLPNLFIAYRKGFLEKQI